MKMGTLSNIEAVAIAAERDIAVLRISRAYEVRGMVQTISSYDSATPGSGTVLNQIQLTYNTFSQLTKEQQEHSGAVTGSSLNVQYGYDSGASSSNEIRPSTITYPNGRVITYSHGTSGGMDDYLNRVTSITDTGGTLAQYTYLGLGTVIRIDYTQPQVRLDLWGGTSGTFNGLDLFNRVIDQRWQFYGTPTADVDRYQYGYDQDSNRIWKANTVTTGLDEFYTYDSLNRLTQMQRGTLNGTKTGITGTPVREMDWTLDKTGNWSGYVTKTSGTDDLIQVRTSNMVNEITAIGGTPTWAIPAYDAAGNCTTFPQPADPSSSYTGVYDAWNRLAKVSAAGVTVAEYKYDGRDGRTVRLTYTGGVLSETRHFYFTAAWQDVEERVGTSTLMDRQYVWGVRYLDELVCRDDATPTRLYVAQDASFNLTTICSTAGAADERYRFDPYSGRTIMNAAWGTITGSAFSWTLGFQGLMHEAECALLNSRGRLIDIDRFLSRNPFGYPDGPSQYEYLGSNPNLWLDPTGWPLVKVGGGRQPTGKPHHDPRPSLRTPGLGLYGPVVREPGGLQRRTGRRREGGRRSVGLLQRLHEIESARRAGARRGPGSGAKSPHHAKVGRLAFPGSRELRRLCGNWWTGDITHTGRC